MAQISRPFQIAIVAVLVLAGVWLFALQGHSSSSSSSAPPPAPRSAAAQAKSAAAPTPIYHGAAPGVAGLSSAVAKAHGAVATSQQNAKQLEQQSAQASNTTSAPSSTAASGGSAETAPTTSKTSTAVIHIKTGSASHKGGAHTLVRQRQVEAELKAGKVVVLLFWDRKGSDDKAVRRAVQAVAGQRRVSVHVAPPSQVASYGTITRGVQVYGTPTVLVIGKAGQATVLAGFTSAYAIRQAIAEARSA